ncbi:hypothetical protein Tsubulata_041698 [Turnera subulata]|uniref:Uncharacterized protein n=1 Tax=Turnera subulata TaxID=218843 RepID=A0A9Q0FII3_9ROSI|nr:hypothetical protein Tsubulata_041698 [Turnera subulata]
MEGNEHTVLQPPAIPSEQVNHLVTFNACPCLPRRPHQPEGVIGTFLGSILSNSAVAIRFFWLVRQVTTKSFMELLGITQTKMF